MLCDFLTRALPSIALLACTASPPDDGNDEGDTDTIGGETPDEGGEDGASDTDGSSPTELPGEGGTGDEDEDDGAGDDGGGTGEDGGEPTANCASDAVDALSGTASRDNTNGYPDHITATVTWQRTRTEGCVDHYTPAGTAEYSHDIPGALCVQTITPATNAVAAGDGALTIDRTVSPARYTGQATTTWTVTHRCEFSDGTIEEWSFEGGGVWFDGAGAVAADGTITGSFDVESDASRCGPQGIAPCAYSWTFAP